MRAGARQQIEALEHEAEPLAAHARAVRLAQARDVDAFEEIAAAARPVEAAEDRHQRRLAGARGAHDGDELAGLDRQADVAQRMHVDVADMVGPRDVLELDDRLSAMSGLRPLAVTSAGCGAGGRLAGVALLVDDDLIARLQIAGLTISA